MTDDARMSSPTEKALDAIATALGADRIRRGAAMLGVDMGWETTNLDAGVMVCPRSTREVATVLRLCSEYGIAVVPQGGRTGLVGGGVSRNGEIILSLEPMNRIEQLDPIARVAVVEAGVTLQCLQEAAAQHRLEPGIDIAARGTATLGGMASTNAGGMMAFRNGVMRHRILGLEAVLPDGEIYSDLTRVVKNSAGYDLKHLFIGAEGTLGIVTRLAIKLDPAPAASATALFGLPSVEAVLDVIRLALDLDGGQLRAAEAMWRNFFELNAGAQGWRDAAFARPQPLYLLLGLGGAEAPALRAQFEDLFGRTLERHPDATGIVAASERQERELWRLREDTATVYRAYPAAPSYDVSVPLSEVATYVERIGRELAALDDGLAPFLFGHLADGNLHIVCNRPGPFDAAMARAVEAILYRDIRGIGGSFSAEHGVGSKRIASLLATSDPGKLDLMARVKALLDPKGLMNPGKVLAGGTL